MPGGVTGEGLRINTLPVPLLPYGRTTRPVPLSSGRRGARIRGGRPGRTRPAVIAAHILYACQCGKAQASGRDTLATRRRGYPDCHTCLRHACLQNRLGGIKSHTGNSGFTVRCRSHKAASSSFPPQRAFRSHRWLTDHSLNRHLALPRKYRSSYIQGFSEAR